MSSALKQRDIKKLYVIVVKAVESVFFDGIFELPSPPIYIWLCPNDGYLHSRAAEIGQLLRQRLAQKRKGTKRWTTEDMVEAFRETLQIASKKYGTRCWFEWSLKRKIKKATDRLQREIVKAGYR